MAIHRAIAASRPSAFPCTASAANVLQGFTDKLLDIAQPMRLSMTCDQGREMGIHKKLGGQTGTAVYFCDPHSP